MSCRNIASNSWGNAWLSTKNASAIINSLENMFNSLRPSDAYMRP